MPFLDVSGLLADPDFSDRFTVLRRLQTVNANGETQVTTTTIPDVVGVVAPTGDNSLARQEAYQTQAKSIQVTTKFRLRGASRDGAGNQYQPDIVCWHGDQYVVRMVDDFSGWGGGFIQAECTSIDLLDRAPQ